MVTNANCSKAKKGASYKTNDAPNHEKEQTPMHTQLCQEQSNSQPNIEGKSPLSTPILDAIKLRTVAPHHQGGSSVPTTQKEKGNVRSKKQMAKPKQSPMLLEGTPTPWKQGASAMYVKDIVSQDNEAKQRENKRFSNNVHYTAEPPITVKEMLTGNPLMDVNPSVTSNESEPLATPQALPQLKKRKSEVDEDTEAYIPGMNTFFPLMQDEEPVIKKARNRSAEGQTDDSEISDGVDGLSRWQVSLAPSQEENNEGHQEDMDEDEDIHIVTTQCQRGVDTQSLYTWEQINNIFSSQKSRDILIIVWGMECKNLAYSTEIAPPIPPPTYHMKGQVPSDYQPFIQDHTGTPFTFYVRGLEEEEKALILKEVFIPTNHDLYIVLDAKDFVTNFVFTINDINTAPNTIGQSMVEKLIKDKFYVLQKVWSFLMKHHNAIDPTIPADEVPALVILSLEVRGIWVEG
ncbi:hypothetical protein EDD18DRAFT_1102070 [Armillaria luteobubalina]|uniref:Uncharacterized protein n=1 Tax=Armillaria luteobubalina TaxID=153913 RepID=A0AA39QET9_9AGAR|nr:hypothetical protein EDD18DRAFT_1102070 [Armillaria luteobubalina]